MKKTIIEIIQHECEQYRLKEFGLLTSIEEEADRLLLLLEDKMEDIFSDTDAFGMWREKVIDLFYSRLGYMEFLKEHKDELTFSRFLLFLRKRQV